jgi:hypothetical protein
MGDLRAPNERYLRRRVALVDIVDDPLLAVEADLGSLDRRVVE